MQILLVDADEARRARWCDNLSGSDVVTTDFAQYSIGVTESRVEGRFASIVLGWDSTPEWSDQARELLRSLRGNGCWAVCLLDRTNDNAIQQAFSIGFDDCLFDNSSAEEISTKIENVRKLENLHQRLEHAQKLESIGELATGIAHEINTPIQYVGDNTRFFRSAYEDLASVLDQCQALLQAAEAGEDLAPKTELLRTAIDDADILYLQEEVPPAIQQTLDGVDRVTNIVRAMKEFAHPGSFDMVPTDLVKAIDSTVMLARNEWKYVADMDVDVDDELPWIPSLPGQLNQVLLNIIVNASHAISESLGEFPDKKGQLSISAKKIDEYAEIRISDTGCGIAPENIERIFTPFFTTKAAGKGTGQGLAIAHSVVVDKHKGTISVESTVGEGTTFVIRLPLEVPETIDARVSATEELAGT